MTLGAQSSKHYFQNSAFKERLKLFSYPPRLWGRREKDYQVRFLSSLFFTWLQAAEVVFFSLEIGYTPIKNQLLRRQTDVDVDPAHGHLA